VLEEAVPFPTDVVGGLVGGPGALIPGVTKDRFNVNVQIESNDMLFQFRSDSIVNLSAVVLWLQGSNNMNGVYVPSPSFNGLLRFQPPRIQFVQVGLPRKMAVNYGFEFGSIAHFSHVIEDLYQFYSLPGQDSNRPEGEPFTERCQYMFRSNQLGTPHGLPAEGNADQFTNGGGPAFINNVFQGTDAALLGAQDSAGTFGPGNRTLSATFTGTPRVGHNAALQRASRASDGTPLHIRNDGPGLDTMDVPAFRTFPGPSGTNVPAGSYQFKL
jgi:hypothetical protein